MGRRSKLTEAQWVEISRRHIEGESLRSLAREFGVSESTVREKVSAQSAQIKTVANQIVATERAVMALPISAQITAHNLASKLRAISDNLASAAHYGAQTAHRLNALANTEVQKVDDAQPLASVESLKGVAALTKLANDSASIALNLLAANKDTVQRLNEQAPEAPTIDPKKLSDGALEELLNARAQKRPDRACDVGDWAGESRTAAA
jgi:hypothetical protein